MYSYDRLTLRIEPFSGPQRYEVYCEAQTGEGHGQFDLPFESRDLENFVLRMSRGRHTTRRIETQDTTRVKDFGRELFSALFTGEVRDVYRTALAEARRESRGLRVTLQLTKVPELMDVPWEYLYDEPDFLSVSAWTPIVRYLDISRPRPVLMVEPPLRVLGMVSDASDLAQLDVEGERERLEDALRPLVTSGRVEVHWTSQATLTALLRKLRLGEFHIFHYIGHGAYDEERQDGVLLLEDEEGRACEVSGDRLGTILRDHLSLRLAVLNACEGARSSHNDPFAGVAASLVQREIPAVVAMQFEITDDAALRFAEYFYEALAAGHPVDAAIAEARQGIFAGGNDVEWGTPVLFLRPLDGRIFDVKAEQARPAEPTLALACEARPAQVAAGDPVEFVLRIENAGQPSLFRVSAIDARGDSLGKAVDLVSGEDASFTWSSPVGLETDTTVQVVGRDSTGRPVEAKVRPRLDVLPPVPALPLQLTPDTEAFVSTPEPRRDDARPPEPSRLARLLRDRWKLALSCGLLVVAAVIAAATGLVGGGGNGTAQLALIGSPVHVGRAPETFEHGFGAIWVGDSKDGTVTRVDDRTGKKQVIKIPQAVVSDIVMSDDAVWANAYYDAVIRIDPKTNQQRSVTLPSSEYYELEYADGYVWLLDEAKAIVRRIDAKSNRLDSRVVRFGGKATGFAVGDGVVYLGRPNGSVDLRTPDSPGYKHSIAKVGEGLGGMQYADGAVYVATSAKGIVRIDPRSFAVEEAGHVKTARAAGFHVDDDRLFVTFPFSRTIERVDLTGKRPAQKLKVDGQPEWVLAAGRNLWLINGDNTLTRARM